MEMRMQCRILIWLEQQRVLSGMVRVAHLLRTNHLLPIQESITKWTETLPNVG